MIGIDKFFDFQERCIQELLDKSKALTKKGIVIKSPTGSGKTLFLLEYIDRYLMERKEDDTVFIWFTPGAGELEEQSQREMEQRLKHREALLLSDALGNGVNAGDTVFINWEQVNKDGNSAITPGEKNSLIDIIKKAHRSGLRFFIIVDEEHLYNTPKSKAIIDYFSAEYIIRASATAKKNENYDWFEIPEIEVINEGLITKALYINEDLESGEVDNEPKLLIDLANKKRKEIKKEYEKLQLDVNPLILIQFPDSSTELIESVEEYLAELGYSYDREISKWLADDKEKINLENITSNNGEQIFLLMKQAVAIGWNCPRAKILVKLRELVSEDFQIQTIGRLRRTIQSKHYDNELLDTCYLYTLDENFKHHVKQDMTSAYEVRRIKLKDDCKMLTLQKEFRDEDYGGVNQKDAYRILEKYFYEKYDLITPAQNKQIFLQNGYELCEEIITNPIKDKVTLTKDLESNLETVKLQRKVNTHNDSLNLRQTTDTLKTIVGVTYSDMNNILRKLFLGSQNCGKLLNLTLSQYYAFIINNRDRLRNDLRESTATVGVQASLSLTPKVSKFNMPNEMLFQYGPSVEDVEVLVSNAYHDYSTDCFVIRSKPERLFERYCESNESVKWVYKNGDNGSEYFSIVYITGMLKQRLFYPDYIVKLKNGDTWIIETKGGETQSGRDCNVDIYAKQKFDALKTYSKNNNVKFGFVREKIFRDQIHLFLNNTEYTEEMSSENWRLINEHF